MGRYRTRAFPANACLALAAAVLSLSGCGAMLIQAPLDGPAAELAGADAGSIEARPVADLTGMGIGLPRFFVGVALGRAYPNDSTLDPATVYDFSMVYDISSKIYFEALVGVWDFPDRPMPGADSSLKMRPLMASLQVNLLQRAKWRAYAVGGGGISLNDYELGGPHRAAVMIDSGSPFFRVEADNCVLIQLGGGIELYSDADAAITVALETRYVMGDAEVTEQLDIGTTLTDREINIWLLRLNLSWHF